MYCYNLKASEMKIDEFANRVDPDEPPHLNLPSSL